jgi:hypothetical protein
MLIGNSGRSGIMDESQKITLSEAFDTIGKTIFGDEWLTELIELDQSDSINAPSEMMNRYEFVHNFLTEALWNKQIESFGINQSGERTSIGYSIWKDTTRNTVIHFGKSLIETHIDGSNQRIDVLLDKTGVDDIVAEIVKARGTQARVERAKKSNKSGRHIKFNWEKIKPLIINYLKSNPPPINNTDCKNTVVKKLKQKGWTYASKNGDVKKEIPGDSAIIKCIAKLKKANKYKYIDMD